MYYKNNHTPEAKYLQIIAKKLKKNLIKNKLFNFLLKLLFFTISVKHISHRIILKIKTFLRKNK